MCCEEKPQNMAVTYIHYRNFRCESQKPSNVELSFKWMLWSSSSSAEAALPWTTEESSGQLIHLFVLPAVSSKGTFSSSQASLCIRNSPHISLTWEFHLLGFWGVGWWGCYRLSSRPGLKACMEVCLHWVYLPWLKNPIIRKRCWRDPPAPSATPFPPLQV